MSVPVLVEVKNNIAHVWLNRPNKYNALDLDMFRSTEETTAKQRCRNGTHTSRHSKHIFQKKNIL